MATSRFGTPLGRRFGRRDAYAQPERSALLLLRAGGRDGCTRYGTSGGVGQRHRSRSRPRYIRRRHLHRRRHRSGTVVLLTPLASTRIVDVLVGDPFPRPLPAPIDGVFASPSTLDVVPIVRALRGRRGARTRWRVCLAQPRRISARQRRDGANITAGKIIGEFHVSFRQNDDQQQQRELNHGGGT
jgi:hypothetical protein